MPRVEPLSLEQKLAQMSSSSPSWTQVSLPPAAGPESWQAGERAAAPAAATQEPAATAQGSRVTTEAAGIIDVPVWRVEIPPRDTAPAIESGGTQAWNSQSTMPAGDERERWRQAGWVDWKAEDYTRRPQHWSGWREGAWREQSLEFLNGHSRIHLTSEGGLRPASGRRNFAGGETTPSCPRIFGGIR